MASVLELPAFDSSEEASDQARPRPTVVGGRPAGASPTPLFELPVPEPFPGYNRRFFPRVRRDFPVRDRQTGESGRGIDLSFGGMMVATGEPVWPGNRVSYEVDLGESGTVTLAGTVVELVAHRGRLAMRVSFDEPNIATRRTIADWMTRGVGV